MFPKYQTIVKVVCLFVALPSMARQCLVAAPHGLIKRVADGCLQDVADVDDAEVMLLQQGMSVRNRNQPVHNSTKTTLLGSNGLAKKQKNPVLILLFMAIDSLPHVQLWQDWSAPASKGSWHAFLHCVNYTACEQGTLALWPELKLVPTVDSWLELVSPMQQLLKHAVNALPNPDGDVSEKFIFLSETTLPMKPFADVHMELGKEDVTDICFGGFPSDNLWPSSQALDRHGKKHTVKLPKHSQWVILRRTDAELFVRDWVQGQNCQTGWAVPLKDGHFTGKNRTVSSKAFSPLFAPPGGLDEFATFATLYGAYQSNGQLSTHYPAMGLSISDQHILQYQGRCRTHVLWNYSVLPHCPDMKYTKSDVGEDSGHSPIEINSADRCLLQHERDGRFLFMRKFKTGSVRRDDFREVILN